MYKSNYNAIVINSRQCLVVTLERMMQREISDFAQYWNSHSIRVNSTAECPSGIPEDMYDMPSQLGIIIIAICK